MTPASSRRAALDPALSLCLDRYECSMALAGPSRKRAGHFLREFSRALAVGVTAVAATIGGYLLQAGR